MINNNDFFINQAMMDFEEQEVKQEIINDLLQGGLIKW